MSSTATKIPPELKRQVNAAIAQYPPERKRSAALPLLHLWQEHFGFISDEGIHWIADKLEPAGAGAQVPPGPVKPVWQSSEKSPVRSFAEKTLIVPGLAGWSKRCP